METAWWLLILAAISFSKSSAELIASLPGQPSNTHFRQHSGYIITDTHHGRALFYYFAEASAVANPLSHPLTLWLNGGPGCSSLGYGAFMEHGPFRVGNDGLLIQNPYSWNLVSNMLYVESPIGVGFSYSNTSEDYVNWNDMNTANENLIFLLKWLEEFPQYKDSDIYLTGESYAGHYIPQLAALIMEHNKITNVKPIKLKAIALGNPLLDADISVNSGEYLWAHGVISEETLMLEKTICNDSRYMMESLNNKLSQECKGVFKRVNIEFGPVDDSDLLLPLCLSSINAQQSISAGAHARMHAKLALETNGDPCLPNRISTYLNKPQVQKALHANTTGLSFHWDFCSRTLKYQRTNLLNNIIPLLSYLLQEGIPVLLYSGDQDTKIPLTQTRMIANKLTQQLKLTAFTSYVPWYDNKQVGGWAQSFGALRDGKNVTYLTFATVRGAAHEVPFTSPSQALALFKAFLSGSPLPNN